MIRLCASVETPQRGREQKAPLEEEQQKKPGAGSTHTRPRICLILSTVLVYEFYFFIFQHVGRLKFRNISLPTRLPCTAICTSVQADIYEKFSSENTCLFLSPLDHVLKMHNSLYAGGLFKVITL